MDTLKLSTPKQHSYSDPTVERNPARLRSWLRNLPLMDVVKTVRLVLGAVNALNEQKLAPEKRCKLLEIYQSTVYQLFTSLDPLCVRPMALGKAQWQEVTAGMEDLLLAMAAGYKLIVKHIYHDVAGVRRSGLFGVAVCRSVEALGLALQEGYRYYRDVPPTLFSELHQLYRIARHQGFLQVAPGAENRSSPQLDLAAWYQTTLLLSLTDPRRLAEGEVGRLSDLLTRHAGQCRIVPGNNWTGIPEGLYFIDLAGGEPPRFCVRLEPPVEAGEPYLLDARNALHSIREELTLMPARLRRQSPEALALRRLLPEQADPRRTREARHPERRWVSVLFGLNSIHEYLLQGAGHRSATQPRECRVADASANGLGLVWEYGVEGDTQVGELLGVVDGDATSVQLQLVHIRSLRVCRDGGMEIGTQRIHGAVGPVQCSVPDAPDDAPVPALFMPARVEEEISATLLARQGFYEPERRMLIDVGGRKVQARMGRCVHEGPVFERFEFLADSEARDVKREA